ncbi:hypothetical protein QCA50_019504 [Cerrena zonata]|uniref:Uncharacterized protein n=1 Tax=Cerrena zonata TaxID=2478898 RepID=A0AAW0F9A2_9APHY
MALPDYVPHSMNLMTRAEDADAIFQQIGAMTVDVSLRSTENKEGSTQLSQVTGLLRITVQELCRVDGSPVTKSIICSFLSALSSFVSGDIWTIVDTPFLLPRLNEFHGSGDVMDGHALMLALLRFDNTANMLDEERVIAPCLAESNPFPRSPVDTVEELSYISLDPSPSGGETSHSGNETGHSGNETSQSEHETSQLGDKTSQSGGETASQSPAPPAPFPPDTHILLNRNLADGVDVPLLVAAESTNIKYLMISALYQRFVLSIDEPLIGVEISGSSSVVLVHFGWLDTTAKVPIAHIAYSTRNTQYDLRNLSEAHNFARFIFSLRAHGRRISLAMCTPRIRKFCWCLDHIALARPKPHKASIVKVARWLMNLPIRQKHSRSSSCPAVCRYPIGVVQGGGHRSDGSVTTRRLTFDKDEHTSTDHSSSSEDEEKGVDEGLHMLSVIPSSRPLLLDSFLFERDVVMIGNSSPHKTLPHQEHMTIMHNLYSALSGGTAVQKWNSTEYDLSCFCSQPLEKYCRTLVEQNQRSLNEGSTPRLLEENLVSLLEKKLDIILLPSHYLSCIPRNEEKEPSIYRHIWEYFFAAFCSKGGPADNDIDLCFDVKARISRNRHVDMLQDILHSVDSSQPPTMTVEEFKEYTKALSRDMMSRCSTDAIMSLDPSMTGALSIMFGTYRHIYSICELEDHIFSEMILQRARTEPWEGLCDIIALRPAVFETPSGYRNSRTVSCSSDCSFVVPEASLPSKTNLSCDIPQVFVPLQNRYPGRWSKDYELKWRLDEAPTPMQEASELFTSASASSSSIPLTNSDGPFMLPFIIALCMEKSEGYWDSTQRMSIHLGSAVDLYAHLGIKDHPVWGLLIGGARCGVLMAWRSSENNRTYVYQRAIRVYDITVPYEAMQLASFLVRVKESQRALPWNGVIASHLKTSEMSSLVDDGDNSHIVLTMDSNCTDPEGKWSKWMKAKQSPNMPI